MTISVDGTTNEWTFTHEHVDPIDVNLFDMDGGILFTDNHCLAHIMHWADAFSSVSQARKNGWDKPVPWGFSEFKVGKLKKHIFILNRGPKEETIKHDIK
jgi:hypothetical protein